MLKDRGQYALKEKLFLKHGDMQIRKHIVQQRIIQGYIRGKSYEVCKGCPKNLCLDYISDYTRIIPFDIIRKKTDIDKYEIFDNYVILHYDFDNNGTDLPV